MNEIKTKYPEGLGPESVVKVLKGPREQAPEILRGIIGACREWPTKEAALLAKEAETLLREATGDAAEDLIADGLEEGDCVAYKWSSEWLCEDLLRQAWRIWQDDYGCLRICGYRDGWPWEVVLVYVPDYIWESLSEWTPSADEVAEEERLAKWALQQAEEMIADNQKSCVFVGARVKNPRERGALVKALKSLSNRGV